MRIQGGLGYEFPGEVTMGEKAVQIDNSRELHRVSLKNLAENQQHFSGSSTYSHYLG